MTKAEAVALKDLLCPVELALRICVQFTQQIKYNSLELPEELRKLLGHFDDHYRTASPNLRLLGAMAEATLREPPPMRLRVEDE